jgi:hypothetical protein
MKMATAMIAGTFENLQHSTRFISESRSRALISNCEHLRTGYIHIGYSFSFSDSSVFRATFTTVKVCDLKSHKNFALKTIHFTTCFGYTEPSSGELNLLVETAVLFALGMVPALYIFCA